jgi:hypothetical protein
LLNETEAKQVGGLACAVITDQDLGEAGVVVGVGGRDRLAAAVVNLLYTTAVAILPLFCTGRVETVSPRWLISKLLKNKKKMPFDLPLLTPFTKTESSFCNQVLD